MFCRGVGDLICSREMDVAVRNIGRRATELAVALRLHPLRGLADFVDRRHAQPMNWVSAFISRSDTGGSTRRPLPIAPTPDCPAIQRGAPACWRHSGRETAR